MKFKLIISLISLLYIFVLYGFFKSYDELIECKVFFSIQDMHIDEDFFQSHIRAEIARNFSRYVKSDRKRIFQNTYGNKAEFIIQYQLYSKNATPSFFEKLLLNIVEGLKDHDHFNLDATRVSCEHPIKIHEKLVFVLLITFLFFLIIYKVSKKPIGI